jgi:hypothetical protein
VLRMRATGRTVFLQPHTIRIVPLVLIAGVVPVTAFVARKPEPSVMYPALPCHARCSLLLGLRGQDETSRRRSVSSRAAQTTLKSTADCSTSLRSPSRLSCRRGRLPTRRRQRGPRYTTSRAAAASRRDPRPPPVGRTRPSSRSWSKLRLSRTGRTCGRTPRPSEYIPRPGSPTAREHSR